jgi:hypothetical protein
MDGESDDETPMRTNASTKKQDSSMMRSKVMSNSAPDEKVDVLDKKMSNKIPVGAFSS